MNPSNFKKGHFTPQHPEKYVGNINNIIYRSSWEEEYCKFCDNNSTVLRWASEELFIKYIHPFDGKLHKYFPDFWMEILTRHGQKVQEIVEVKPFKQTQPPTTVGKRKKQQLFESNTFSINKAKWQAAQNYCNKYNIRFRIITEKELFGDVPNANRKKGSNHSNKSQPRRSPRSGRRNNKRTSNSKRNSLRRSTHVR